MPAFFIYRTFVLIYYIGRVKKSQGGAERDSFVYFYVFHVK